MLTGSREAPAITFSTFQPLDLNRRSCQGPGLLLGPRLQAPEGAWPSPRGPAVQAVVSGNLGGTSSSTPTSHGGGCLQVDKGQSRNEQGLPTRLGAQRKGKEMRSTSFSG